MKKKVILSAFLAGVMCLSGCENSNKSIMTETEAVGTTSVLTTTQALKLDNSEYSEPKIIHTETMDELICNFLTALMNGDEETYNACFKNGYGKKFDDNYENYRRKLLENGYQKDHVFNLSEIKVFIAERPYDPTAYRSSAYPDIYFPEINYTVGLSIETDIDTELYYIKDLSGTHTRLSDQEKSVARGSTTRINIDNSSNFDELPDSYCKTRQELVKAVVQSIIDNDEEAFKKYFFGDYELSYPTLSNYPTVFDKARAEYLIWLERSDLNEQDITLDDFDIVFDNSASGDAYYHYSIFVKNNNKGYMSISIMGTEEYFMDSFDTNESYSKHIFDYETQMTLTDFINS